MSDPLLAVGDLCVAFAGVSLRDALDPKEAR
jgi:hypothetical protein